MNTRRFLIIDDSEADRMVLKRFLERDDVHTYVFHEEDTIAAGLREMRREEPDCVLLDFSLPDGTALDFVEALTRDYGTIQVPIVIQTGTGSQADAVKLLKAGAHDYLLKSDLTAEALRLAVNGAIYRVQTSRLLNQQQEELRRSLEEAKDAREASERAHAAKDEFLAMLSHELRTPLTPVLSAVSSALAEPGMSPDTRETFSLIQRNVQVEARLIDDLLDLTRIVEGRFRVATEPTDLYACIDAAIGLARAATDAKGISIETDSTSPRPTVMGDFARLQQLFWTVLKNASEFTADRGCIRVSTERRGGNISIEIRDFGSGIPPEKLSGVFEAFQHPGGYNRFGTLGIGLAIARSIAKAHGGSLDAQSEGEGRGATFTLTLPEYASANGSVTNEPSANTKQGRTILVVEDHEDTRRVLARALRRRGYGVTLASSVAEACDQFFDHPTDLMICDIGLPDGSGWDVVRRVREKSGVKAIAVTGYGMDADIEKSKAAGFDAHITKPIEFPRLEKLIGTLLESSAA
jgi:signal transduction histidine kinase